MTETETTPSQRDAEIAELEESLFKSLDSSAIKFGRHKSLNEDKEIKQTDFYSLARAQLEKALYMGGGDQEKKEAYRLFLLGVEEALCPKCLYGVGICLYNGYGVNKNTEKGEKILNFTRPQIESMTTSAEALVIMYEYYEYGYGVQKDNSKALSFLSRAECPRGKFLLSYKTDADPEVLLRAATKESFPPAFFVLGTLYRTGSAGSFKSKSKINIGRANNTFSVGATLGCEKCKRAAQETSYHNKGFTILDGVLLKCTAQGNEVHVPKVVTSIGKNAFAELRTTTLYLPDTVTSLSKNAFDKNHIPKIVSKHVNAKTFATMVKRNQAKKDMSKKLKGVGGMLLDFIQDHPIIFWSFIAAAVIAATGTILHFTNAFPLNIPSRTPLIFYLIGLGIMVIITLSLNIGTDRGVGFYIATAIFTLGAAFIALYGGIINEKWCFIPIAAEVMVILFFLLLPAINSIGGNAFSAMAIPTGLVVIFGGMKTGVFNLCIPNVGLAILYVILGLSGLVFFLFGFAYGENDQEMALVVCAPIVLLAIIGFCFAGSFVWWGHLIMFVAMFFEIGFVGSFVGENMNF